MVKHICSKMVKHIILKSLISTFSRTKHIANFNMLAPSWLFAFNQQDVKKCSILAGCHTKAAAFRNTAVIIQFSKAAIAFLLYIRDITVMSHACSSLFWLAYRGMVASSLVDFVLFQQVCITFYGSTASFNQHLMCYLKRYRFYLNCVA